MFIPSFLSFISILSNQKGNQYPTSKANLMQDIIFYQSLSYAALYLEATPEDQTTYYNQLKLNYQKLKDSSEQFALLIQAEIAKIDEKPIEAMELYDQAIQAAKQNKNWLYYAIANELAGNFWQSKNKPEFADIYYKKAYQSYLKIKQSDKILDLIKKSPDLTKLELFTILEKIPLGIQVINPDQTNYYTNQYVQEIIPLCKKIKIELPIITALQGTEAIADLEITYQGNNVTIESQGFPIFDEAGKVIYAIATYSEKKQSSDHIKLTEELFKLNQAYQKFVPIQFIQILEKKSIVDIKLGDQVQKEMSVLFADIRDFTSLSERMTPQENFKFINSYLSVMEPVIIQNQGFIDKFMGDAIMALFNGSADDAVRSGINMLHSLIPYNQGRMRAGYEPIRIGIGINTGTLMLGTVGGYSRMDTTVISDTVNLASRLEGLTKEYGVSLLISHQTFAQLDNPNDYNIRMIDRLKVKGKSKDVAVFEVFNGDPPELRQAKLDTRIIFEEALLLVYRGLLSEAKTKLIQSLEMNPNDKVAQIYLKRCQTNSID